MKSLFMALLFGVSISVIAYSQDKSDKSCCSSEKSKNTTSKICDVPDEVSSTSVENNNLTATIQGDEKNKKVEKNSKSTDYKLKKDNSHSKSSDDECCSTDKKKTEKTKSPKSKS